MEEQESDTSISAVSFTCEISPTLLLHVSLNLNTALVKVLWKTLAQQRKKKFNSI